MITVNTAQYVLNMYNPIGVIPKVIPGIEDVGAGVVVDDLILAQLLKRKIRGIRLHSDELWTE
jgi:hypothetical protein